MSGARRVALITGANRGMGLETARGLAGRGWDVVITARDGGSATREAERLQLDHSGVRVVGHTLDVCSGEQARAVAAFVRREFGRLDTLVNNAGAQFEPGWPSALDADLDAVRQSLETNTLGALQVSQVLAPLIVESGGGNIVQVSSGMGALHDMGGAHVGYRMSKTALNTLTRILHAELHDQGVRCNSVCPGWVRTGFSPESKNAPRSVEEGAAGILWAATLEVGGPSGGFFRDGEPIGW